MKRQSNIFFLFLIIVLLLAACSGAAETPEPPAPSGEMQYGKAPVESVEVVFLESFPLQVQLQVEGYLPDGCTEIESTEVERQGDHFEVTITTSRPAEMACTQAIEPFEMNIPLDVYGLPAGEYTVDVNGVETSFTFSQDNILETE